MGSKIIDKVLLSLVLDAQCAAKLRGLVALCTMARADAKPLDWEVQHRLCYSEDLLYAPARLEE